MKRQIPIIFVSLLSVFICNAQGLPDVIRYGLENEQGTARFQALSGAFGALGGDLSAIAINPASSAVFNRSKTTFSSSFFMYDNTTSYFDNEENNVNDYNIDMNQAGGVFVFNIGNEDSKFKKITLGLNYQQVNNYQNELYVSGQSPVSIDQYFLSYATGRAFGEILPLPGESLSDAYVNIGTAYGFAHQQAFLGYQIGIINSIDDSNPAETNYFSDTGDLSSIHHEYLLLSEGSGSKFTLNLASQYDNFYFGVSANFHNVNYNRLTQFNETGYQLPSPMQYMYFDNLLNTRGNGFSFTAGGIAKIKDFIRVGLAYQSPVWYSFTDELSQEINSNLAFPDLVQNINLTSSRIVNIFPEYKMQTPAKYTGSVAVVFGRHGLISFDYDYQDFSTAKFKPESDADLMSANLLIENRLQAMSTFRIGGEYRVAGSGLSVRGGYRIQDSPYVNGINMGKLNGYSFGLGYNFGSSQIDISYSQFSRSENQALFETGFSNTTDIDATRTNVILSMSVGL